MRNKKEDGYENIVSNGRSRQSCGWAAGGLFEHANE
jgi:hypothetical protein